MSERGQRLAKVWDRRVTTWHEHVESSTAFDSVRAAVLTASGDPAGRHVVDLGSGTGFLTLALAGGADRVLAVDVSREMLERLSNEADARHLTNVRTQLADLASFTLPTGSVDLIVTSYALHHLRHLDKTEVVSRARHWLRPGGQLVIADMMFGRGATATDRAILRRKATAMLRKGPAGAVRLGKNLVRFGLGVGVDRPAPPEFWTDALHRAGFHEVTYTPIVAEAGLVTGLA